MDNDFRAKAEEWMKTQYLGQDSNAVDHFFRLGQFLHSFSASERNLREVLRCTTGLDRETGKAVFYSVRVNDGIDTLARIYKVRNEFYPVTLKRALRQLKAINIVRNSLMHHGTFFDERAVTSNRLTAISPEGEKEFEVGKDILHSMYMDLSVIEWTLIFFTAPIEERRRMVRAEAQLRAYAWRYIPPPQGGRPPDVRAKKKTKSRQQRTPPPQASPQ